MPDHLINCHTMLPPGVKGRRNTWCMMLLQVMMVVALTAMRWLGTSMMHPQQLRDVNYNGAGGCEDERSG